MHGYVRGLTGSLTSLQGYISSDSQEFRGEGGGGLVMCGLPGGLQGACLCPVPGEGRCLEDDSLSLSPLMLKVPLLTQSVWGCLSCLRMSACQSNKSVNNWECLSMCRSSDTVVRVVTVD